MRFNHFKRLIVLFLLSNHSPMVFAQFIDVSADLGQPIYTSPGSANGNGMSFYDFNKDGWDDLSISRGNNSPLFFINNNGNFVNAGFDFPIIGNENIQSLVWADYDNDGDEDLLITKKNGPVELWKNDGAFNFSNVAAQAGLYVGNYFHVGASFADFNHDGCLDLYVAKFYDPNYFNQIGEQYESKLYRNNCDGTFTDVTEISGVRIPPSLTYGAVFIDYNNDGWEDLYLINDLIYFSNYLFRNNGDNTFTDVSANSGSNLAIDAMTATIGDFDNDQDLDIFITNRPGGGPLALLVNNGDETFSEEAQAYGIDMTQLTWGANWLDYDNDSWQDLFVGVAFAEAPYVGNEFFINNEGFNFTPGRNQVGFENDFSITYTCSRGDINNDGYFDIALNNWFTTPFKFYQNDGGDNNYLSVNLEGTISNKNGIGTWLHCFTDGNHYVRYTLCGEDLINQNSGKQIFGLGEIGSIDSLVIEWNRGTRDVYHNLAVNQHLHLIEGASLSVPFAITYSDDLFLCEGDSLELVAGEFESYQWSNGDSTNSTMVYSPGVYSVSVTNQFGFTIQSFDLIVMPAPVNEATIITTNISCFLANDGAVEVSFSNTPLNSFQWNTGHEELLISNLSSGAYSFLGEDSYGCSFIGNVFISEPLPLEVIVESSNPGCHNSNDGVIEIDILGGTYPYQTNWNGIDPTALPAGDYSFVITDSNLCSFQYLVTLFAPEPIEISLSTQYADENNLGSATATILGGTPPYLIEWSNGLMNEYQNDGLLPGNYWVSVVDANACINLLEFEIGWNVGEPHLEYESCRIYPNPFNDNLQISCPEKSEFNVSIIDSYGKLLHSGYSFNGSITINATHWSSGVYILALEISNEMRFSKLLKK